nr:ATP-binding protein [Atopomonas sediminilitoris]
MVVEQDELASNFIQQQRASAGWAALLVLGLALLLAVVWAQWFVRPIRRVAQGAQQVALGNYQARVSVSGQDELADLAQHFNAMAQALGRDDQRRRQWLADISHELRTPIAVISAEVEALQDGIRQPTPERIAALYADLRALGVLIEDLHQLSLADQGALALTWASVDLHALVQSHGVLFTPRMAAQQLRLSVQADGASSCWVRADARRLSQVLNNLLHNSARYTDPGGEVRVHLSATADQVRLVISDSAPAVPAADIDKIFDRLYRVDSSRSRLAGGSGLGLSICKTIIEAHGGSIVAAPSALGGLQICITLPKGGARSSA